MTSNRNIRNDRTATSAVLVEVSATGQIPTGRPDWLGHIKGAAEVNALLTRGATIEELSATRRRTAASVWAHMTHLRNEHGLIIARHGGLYRFLDPRDYEDFSDEDQPGDPDDATSKFGPQPSPEEESTIETELPIPPEKSSPDAVLTSDFRNWGAVARSGNGTGFDKLFDRELIKQRYEKDPVSIIFSITGTDSEGVSSAVTAVATALCRIEKPGAHTWGHTRLANGSYNYRYRAADNLVFYVGKGTGRRVYEHVSNVFRKLQATPAVPLNGAKEMAIAAQIQRAATNTVKAATTAISPNISIEQFCHGRWSELVAFVVEKLYISNIYGAYNIANDTSGNSRHEFRDKKTGSSSLFRWVVQPKQVSFRPDQVKKWSEISHEFLQRGRLSFGSLAKIVWMDVEPLLERADSVIATLRESPRLQWINAGPQSQTAVIQWNVVDRPYCIELVCSRTAPTVRVNLRPRRGVWLATPLNEDYIKFCAGIGSDSHALRACVIRIPEGPDCFVKPFAPDADGRRDPNFSIADATLKTAVLVDWAEASVAWTLLEAISALLDIL